MIALRDSIGSDLVERTESVFAPGGLLAKAKNFERRPQQQQMAVAVARALEEERHLVVEAGTGIGKSLAYLVPAVLFALGQKKKAIISTHTINLQEQLLYKDIPILQKVLPETFEATLIKGRQNYVCPRRLLRAREQQNDLFTGPEQNELEEIAAWAARTRDGTLSDLSFEPNAKIWAQVCSEAHICTRKVCGQSDRCFYQRARRKFENAPVVVINHTLLFMLLGGVEEQMERETGFLFPEDFLILDEAHTVEQTASRQIGQVVSQYLLRATVQRLYNARSKKGLFTVTRNAAGVRLAAEIVDEIDRFFETLGARCDFRKGHEFRVRQPEIVPDTITGRLIALQSRVAEVLKQQEDEMLKSELLELGRRIAEARSGIAVFLEQSARNHVYWVERTGKVGQLLTLNAAPIDIAPALRQILFREGRTCIMTSATLGVGRKDLAYFRMRVGADEAEPLQLGSPFNFHQQMKMFVVRKMPDPRDAEYENALEHWIEHFVGKTDGHAFVLFTSYRVMQELAGRIENFCTEHNLNLLLHGGGMRRT
jgi:ATP-dependent DNA helicase DinG